MHVIFTLKVECLPETDFGTCTPNCNNIVIEKKKNYNKKDN